MGKLQGFCVYLSTFVYIPVNKEYEIKDQLLNESKYDIFKYKIKNNKNNNLTKGNTPQIFNLHVTVRQLELCDKL